MDELRCRDRTKRETQPQKPKNQFVQPLVAVVFATSIAVATLGHLWMLLNVVRAYVDVMAVDCTANCGRTRNDLLVQR
jgi:hypothetical protein